VDNPARTAEHLARLAQRRAVLRETLTGILAGEREFVWEVGCGHGHFLTAYAQAHPGKLFLGIDVIRERIGRANRKRDRAGLANLHFILAEAQLFLEVLPPNAELLAIFVLFPDPWPKHRHHKHRLMQQGFLDAAAARAGQGTRLYFRTDHEPYFLDAEATIRAHTAWQLVREDWPFEAVTVFQERAPSHRSLVAVRR
jgi:tRNA (guanine-N7-)-methyltransferase